MSNGASNRSFNSDVPEDKWEQAFTSPGFDPDARLERPHDCEHCGRHMKYADQQCGCTAMSNRIGWTGGE